MKQLGVPTALSQKSRQQPVTSNIRTSTAPSDGPVSRALGRVAVQRVDDVNGRWVFLVTLQSHNRSNQPFRLPQLPQLKTSKTLSAEDAGLLDSQAGATLQRTMLRSNTFLERSLQPPHHQRLLFRTRDQRSASNTWSALSPHNARNKF